MSGVFQSEDGLCTLGHVRLSILDLSRAAAQPMSDASGRYRIVFNGEVYNYRELRQELTDGWSFRTDSDTEVLLAAYARWGRGCLPKLIGMFAFAVWDDTEKAAFVARDRFGVKPMFYSAATKGQLHVASEIKALVELGMPDDIGVGAWANYFAYASTDEGDETFWKHARRLPPGHFLLWRNGSYLVQRWYDLAAEIQDEDDPRPEAEVIEEYSSLLDDSIALRFRSDVPVGISLSGGIDSCALATRVHRVRGDSTPLRAYTFVTGDTRYDEDDLASRILAPTSYTHVRCRLYPEDVPELALRVQEHQDEPFGGLPTIAYSKVFQAARGDGVTVILDGQGLDEQWAGYDYYARAHAAAATVQGTTTPVTRSAAMTEEFAAAASRPRLDVRASDALRRLQLRDVLSTKIPRATRYNDRISMMHSTELREPFLDHRLFELSIAQPAFRKVHGGVHKVLLRKMLEAELPLDFLSLPKRPLQTPQREWLRGPLRDWVRDVLSSSLLWQLGWFDRRRVESFVHEYMENGGDNSFFLWQWLNLSLWLTVRHNAKAASLPLQPT